MSDVLNNVGVIFASSLTFLVIVGLLAWALAFCFVDARRRGKSPLLVTLLVFLSFPLGLIAWLLFRPEPLQGGSSGFRLKDHRVQWVQCGRD